VILFLNQAVKVLWGPIPLNMPAPEVFSGTFQITENLQYPVWRIVIIALGLAVAALLYVMVTQTRVGTSLRYAIDIEQTRQTFDYLFFDCCRGRVDICAPATFTQQTGVDPMMDQKFNVLFICTGNAARSIFAETILRETARDRFEVFSAGTMPSSELNPFAVEVLNSKGHDTSGLRAKNVAEFQHAEAPRFDFVFTVCDQAANEDCPAWTGQPVSAHWGMPDPVKATGTSAEKSLAFQQAYGVLHRRITAFAALPFDALDRVSLQRAVDDIGLTSTGEPA